MGPEAPLRSLLPDPGTTTVGELFAGYDPAAAAGPERPYLFTNFALTVDGHATIDGRSGPIGSDTDTAILVALRMRAEAVMIGAGTMRAEGYGRVISDPAKRALRERGGLPPDPLMVIVSNRLELPWEAPLFSDGGGRRGRLHGLRGRAAGDGDAGRGGQTRQPRRPRRDGALAADRARRPLAALRGRADPARRAGCRTARRRAVRDSGPADRRRAPVPASSPASRPAPGSSSSSGCSRPAASSTPDIA